jgi:glycopeptide antibiotics resistance protein
MNINFDRLELMPFWTYKCVIAHVPGVSVWDIVLNVVLFLPLGFLVKLLKPSLSIFKMLMVAFTLSLFIETNQYFFEKGVAQFDDVMHNMIGAVIGWLLAKLTSNMLRQRESKV